MKPALVVTADGRTFRGTAVGAEGVSVGEGIFNTAMSGYQEVLTDPSYSGQVVVMTAPHIGNYGVTSADEQSDHPHVSGFITRSLTVRPSSWRSSGGLGEYLKEHDVVSVSDVDTRALTRHLRDRGAMAIAMGSDTDEAELKTMAAAAPSMEGLDLASKVTTKEPYRVSPTGARVGKVVAIDLGLKRDILRRLTDRGHEVVVLSAGAMASEILAEGPDGVFLSNGPGDPAPLRDTISTVQQLLGEVPVFGICLGHQVLALALGAATYKLPFGHHGANHPVRRLEDGTVAVTSQNHGFAADLWSLTDDSPPDRTGLASRDALPTSVSTRYGEVVPTHQNLNDGTLEGLACLEVPAFGVQYHPEASPGPSDAAGDFDRFSALMGHS